MPAPVPSRPAAPGDTPRWPRAVALVDGFHRIVRHNAAFGALFAGDERLIGRSFGDLLRCINVVVEGAECGLTSRCSRCTLARALGRTIQAEERVGPWRLHRTTFVGGHCSERAFRFTTRPRRVGGELLAVLSIDELSVEEPPRPD